MKRLYVLKEARGERLGEKLVQEILTQARDLGYRGMRLDTLPEMTAAQQLYRKYGFVDIAPYYETPIQRTVFMGCEFS
jgi:ribosomal protein S18 acetylase RimI-like enzyme